MTSPANDFLPSASWPNLELRAQLLRRLRTFFHEQNFLEVETPLMSADVVVDRHLDPLSVSAGPNAAIGPAKQLWLQTSPEFGMKRLMAAGARAIYQITRAFRADESGSLHNPEFTIVEWYRRGDDQSRGIQFLSDVAEVLFDRGPARIVSYAEAFERSAGVDPHRSTVDQLAAAAWASGVRVPESLTRDDRDAWLDLLMVGLVEPALGLAEPAILFDYPASQAALAVVRSVEPPLAERFELFLDGVELANGYHELRNAEVLRQRMAEANRQRSQAGKPLLPESNRLLDAMEHGLPECAGVALGFDRAVMLAAGAKTLAEVMAFPIDRA